MTLTTHGPCRTAATVCRYTVGPPGTPGADAPATMSDPEGQPLFRTEMAVRWGDMDALGHVNNIVYFRYFEQVRIAWYESLGFEALESAAQSMVIVDNHAEYLRPLVYPATLEVRMGGHSPGRSSFVSTYTLVSNGTLFTRGRSKVVWVDVAAGRSVALPERVRELLGADGATDPGRETVRV